MRTIVESFTGTTAAVSDRALAPTIGLEAIMDAITDRGGAAAIPPPGWPTDPDPHGHAALLLVESLIHGLIVKSALSVADAIEIIDIAAEVQVQAGEDRGEHPATIAESLGLLHAMSASLSRDLV